jgi:hypothetical protein
MTVEILSVVYVPAEPPTLLVGQLAGPTTNFWVGGSAGPTANLPRSGVDRINR